YPLDQLPTMGGLAATVVVTAPADTFTGDGQKAGRTEGGIGVSPGQLIRLACEAKVLPAVLDRGGHVLDLGRAHRFHNAAQRLALIIEQKQCQHPACETAGPFCHVHHTTAWARGGETNTRDAVLLCPFHHHQTHATGQTYPMRT
ncbi:HNH endonuclease signature motif containing protein, partial [Nocardioides sp.]|uniref:HNH endonuclease signature motif containing protein n=1 Tax=Nocardioides sp. TaxID=35761 RepID=UPI002B26A6B5